jgi:hypothetical protein
LADPLASYASCTFVYPDGSPIDCKGTIANQAGDTLDGGLTCLESVSSNGAWVAFWSDSAGSVNLEIRFAQKPHRVFGSVELTLGSETQRQTFLADGNLVLKFGFQQQSGTLQGRLRLYDASSSGSFSDEQLGIHASNFGQDTWYLWEFKENGQSYWFQSMTSSQGDGGATVYLPGSATWKGLDFDLTLHVTHFMTLGINVDIPDSLHRPLYQSRCTPGP